MPVCGLRGDQGHARGQVDEVAAEQFQVGVDGTDLDAPFSHQVGQAHRLRAGEREVQFRSDTTLEYIQMRGQRQHRLHHVQVVHAGRIKIGQGLGEEIGLLLVVALQADLVAGLQQCMQQPAYVAGGDLASPGPRRGTFQAGLATAFQRIPARVH